MTRRPYAKVLDRALKPFGFARKGLGWTRVRGDMDEMVGLQPSWLSGRTVNLFMKDLETEKIYLEIFGPQGAIQMPSISIRITELVDRHSDWWGDEANGPEEMAEATVNYGLPWFDKVRTLEEQARNWYGRHTEMRGYYSPSMVGLALTLYRMGELEEACAVLRKPVPKTAIAQNVENVARVREWLRCDCGHSPAASLA